MHIFVFIVDYKGKKSMDEKFAQLLKNIDLTTTQIKIYLSVLRNGLSTVLDISKDTKINRSQIYFDTSILIERGILELAAKRKRKFLAVQPNKIGKIIEEKNQKLKELQGVLGEATDFYGLVNKKDDNQFEIKIYEGYAQVKKAFDFELEDAKGSEVYSLVGDVDYQHDFFSETYWLKWNLEFTKSGGKGRMIINKNDFNYSKIKENKHRLSILGRGIENFNLKSNFDVWKDNVLIVSISKNPKAVLIKNQILAEGYKDLFEKLWKISE